MANLEDEVVVAEGSLPDMKTLRRMLERVDVIAAIVSPPGGCKPNS